MTSKIVLRIKSTNQGDSLVCNPSKTACNHTVITERYALNPRENAPTVMTYAYGDDIHAKA